MLVSSKKEQRATPKKENVKRKSVYACRTECNARNQQRKEDAWDSILHATKTLSHLFRLNKLKLKRKICSIRSRNKCRNSEFNQFAWAVLLFLSFLFACFVLAFVSFFFCAIPFERLRFGLYIFIYLYIYILEIGLCFASALGFLTINFSHRSLHMHHWESAQTAWTISFRRKDLDYHIFRATVLIWFFPPLFFLLLILASSGVEKEIFFFGAYNFRAVKQT